MLCCEKLYNKSKCRAFAHLYLEIVGKGATSPAPHLPQILYPNPASNSFFMPRSQTDTYTTAVQTSTPCTYYISDRLEVDVNTAVRISSA